MVCSKIQGFAICSLKLQLWLSTILDDFLDTPNILVVWILRFAQGCFKKKASPVDPHVRGIDPWGKNHQNFRHYQDWIRAKCAFEPYENPIAYPHILSNRLLLIVKLKLLHHIILKPWISHWFPINFSFVFPSSLTAAHAPTRLCRRPCLVASPQSHHAASRDPPPCRRLQIGLQMASSCTLNGCKLGLHIYI